MPFSSATIAAQYPKSASAAASVSSNDSIFAISSSPVWISNQTQRLSSGAGVILLAPLDLLPSCFTSRSDAWNCAHCGSLAWPSDVVCSRSPQLRISKQSARRLLSATALMIAWCSPVRPSRRGRLRVYVFLGFSRWRRASALSQRPESWALGPLLSSSSSRSRGHLRSRPLGHNGLSLAFFRNAHRLRIHV